MRGSTPVGGAIGLTIGRFDVGRWHRYSARV
jgi:hypothetical protein